MGDIRRLYVIASNKDKGLYWNHGISSGVWAMVGSYYLSREEAQKTIDSGLDGHIEYEDI